MNVHALGMIFYIPLDAVSMQNIFCCIKQTSEQNEIILCFSWVSFNHTNVLQIKDECLNLKHLSSRFLMRRIFREKKKITIRWDTHSFSSNRTWWSILFIYFLNQGRLEVECLLYLYVQCGNTYHLGNEHPTLNMVTIVKHVTSPVCCAPTVCLLHGAEDKTDFSLHWKSIIAGATFFNSVNDCTHSYLIHTWNLYRVVHSFSSFKIHFFNH